MNRFKSKLLSTLLCVFFFLFISFVFSIEVSAQCGTCTSCSDWGGGTCYGTICSCNPPMGCLTCSCTCPSTDCGASDQTGCT